VVVTVAVVLVVVLKHTPSHAVEQSVGSFLAAVGQIADGGAVQILDGLRAGLRVPAGVAAGDRSLPVPAVVAFGVLESLGVVEEPDGVVAAVVEIGARRRLQVGDEVLGGGTDVGAVDEVEVGDSGADAAQEGNQRRVVASAEVAVLRSHVVDGVGSR
jgi:hypothetical protein